ncbi:MAG: hypothetical protein ACRCXE_00635 [Metamycoplasmataceae bacterium]
MNKTGFTKISNEKAAQTYGGSPLIFLGALIPLVVPAVSSLVTSFKLLFSDKGEVKSKDGTSSKWEKYEDKSTGIPNKITFID